MICCAAECPGFHAVSTSLHPAGFLRTAMPETRGFKDERAAGLGASPARVINPSSTKLVHSDNMRCRPYSPTCTILFNTLWLHIILERNPLTQNTAWPVPSGLKAVFASAATLVAQTLINTLHSSISSKDVSVLSQTNHKKADEVELSQPAPSFSRHPRRSVCSPGQVRC